MWSELALQFLGMVTNPVVVLLPVLLLLLTRRKLAIVGFTALAGAGFGVMESLDRGIGDGMLVVAASALAGVVAAEVILAIVLPIGMMTLSGMIWVRARMRAPGDDHKP